MSGLTAIAIIGFLGYSIWRQEPTQTTTVTAIIKEKENMEDLFGFKTDPDATRSGKFPVDNSAESIFKNFHPMMSPLPPKIAQAPPKRAPRRGGRY